VTNGEGSAKDAHILMVDDRPENLVALEGILEPLGHTLVRATSGKAALREVLRQDFAVILLDVQMPLMNGFETANLIKSRERSRHTPIIFLTAISKEEEYVFEGYSVGAVDYMFKPFNPVILRSKVEVLVDLYLKSQQVQRQSEMLRQSERRELELRHQARLSESEARYANIVDSAHDAIITFDGERRVTLFNRAAERIFRISSDDALGSVIDEILHLDLSADGETEPAEGEEEESEGESQEERWVGDRVDRGGTRRLAARESDSPTREAVGVRGDGERFPAEYSISSLRVSDETLHTVILRDISERRRAEELLRAQTISLAQTSEELRVLNEQLNDRTAELELAMGARSRFYASMSHELRTPINAILGYSSLLLDEIFGPLNEKQSTSIHRTHKAANHLLDLVNDVLDLSKIEAGKMELQVGLVVFPDVIEDLFITVKPLAEQHGVDLGVEGEDESLTIHSDPRRVGQILLNLLSNAIKFGRGRPVQVVWSRGPGEGLTLEVIDQGEGIASDDLDRIFDEFVQLEEGRETPGTGLGLPISRRLAELLGGSLTVTSTPDEGSVFRLTLPPRPEPDIPPDRARSSGGAGRGATRVSRSRVTTRPGGA